MRKRVLFIFNFLFRCLTCHLRCAKSLFLSSDPGLDHRFAGIVTFKMMESLKVFWLYAQSLICTFTVLPPSVSLMKDLLFHRCKGGFSKMLQEMDGALNKVLFLNMRRGRERLAQTGFTKHTRIHTHAQ